MTSTEDRPHPPHWQRSHNPGTICQLPLAPRPALSRTHLALRASCGHFAFAVRFRFVAKMCSHTRYIRRVACTFLFCAATRQYSRAALASVLAVMMVVASVPAVAGCRASQHHPHALG